MGGEGWRGNLRGWASEVSCKVRIAQFNDSHLERRIAGGQFEILRARSLAPLESAGLRDDAICGASGFEGSAHDDVGQFAWHYNHLYDLFPGERGLDLFGRQGALVN
jgi:hypothetical protein